MMKMSRCMGDVRKKWYARNRKAWVRYRLLMERMTLAALIAAARFVGVRKVMTLERMGILGRGKVMRGAIGCLERHGAVAMGVDEWWKQRSRLSIAPHSLCTIIL
jgi:hypothetical protein